MKKAIICDLDSTLCDINHRLHFIKNENKKDNDWKSFYASMTEDKINDWCYRIIDYFSKDGVVIIYVTGRPDTYKSITVDWLRRNNCPINHVFMRDSVDNRRDWIVKQEIFESNISGKYDVLFCLEDKESVTKMWRSLGLIVLQCADGLY